MQALFKELPAFARFRTDYLTDEAFRGLQNLLLANPVAGDVMEGTGCGSFATRIRAEERASAAASG